MSTTGVFRRGGSYDARQGVLRDAHGSPLLDVTVITIRAEELVAQRLIAVLEYLEHPNVETLLQTSYPGHHGLCLVTPRADGGDGRAYLDANPAADELKIAVEIGQTLRYLHTSTPCIVQGNVDLSSILMHGDTPRLWDFSLCRLDPAPPSGPLAAVAPGTGERGGMLAAMAPELHDGGPVTTASDVYAFGVLLFELFARRRPFAAVPPLYAATRLYEGERPSRDEFPSGARCDAVWAIIALCWAQDPAARPDMTQVEEDLCLVA